MSHVSFGIAIWMTVLSERLALCTFLTFMTLGLLFIFISIMTGKIGDKELRLKWKKQKKELYGSKNNS